jgi:hypothetical protein
MDLSRLGATGILPSSQHMPRRAGHARPLATIPTMSFPMRQRVWLSSNQHLAHFRAIIASASAEDRARLRFAIPEHFPHSQPLPWLSSRIRVPLVLCSVGTFQADAVGLSYAPDRRGLGLPFRALGSRWHNLATDCSFAVPWRYVMSAEGDIFRSPVDGGWDILFVRVRTAQPAPADDFLLCPALGPISMWRRHTHQTRLLEQIRGVVAERSWHTLARISPDGV